MSLGPVLLLILVASAPPGFTTKSPEAGRNWMGNVEIPPETSKRVALAQPSEPANDRAGPDETARRFLHTGTYPVSPPPGVETLADRASNEIGINTAPDGNLLVHAGGFKASGAPVLKPMSRHDPEPWATYTVEGVFQFEDREQDERGFTGVTWMAPIRDADVEFYDVDSGQILGASTTNDSGFFRMSISDGVVRDVSFRAVTSSRLHPGLFNLSVAALPRLGGQPYTLNSPVYPNHSPGTNISFKAHPVNATKVDVGGPFHIFDLAKSAQRYAENMTSSPPPVSLTLHWSRGYSDGKYYDTNGHVYLVGTTTDDDSYDDSVILHEIGHYIALGYSADAGFYGPHGLAGTVDIRIAYTEGLGSYFMGAVRNFLKLRQPLIYIETNGNALNWFGFSFSYDTDTPSSYSNNTFQDWTSANEVAVAHAIFDVVDGVGSEDGSPGVDDDPMGLPSLEGDRLVWNVLVSIRENATGFTKAITMETFYDQWLLEEPGSASEFTQILLANGIEFAPDGYEVDDTSVAATPISAVGDSYHHTFFAAGDEDWSVFTASGGAEYVITTRSLLDGADTVLELYDSDGETLLASNNDKDASSVSSLLDFRTPSTQAYYVRTFRNAETPIPIGEYGKYNLTVYVVPNPEVIGVDPPSGPVSGGTPVVVTGSNFVGGASVRLGVYDAVDIIVVDDHTITATTPANVPGSVDVTVINPPNADDVVPRGARPSGFTYTGSALPPIVRSITPNFGTTAVSTSVTVSGDFFQAGAGLDFDGIPCAACSVRDPKTIEATVPPLPLAVYDVRVTNPDGGNDTLANGFESASYAAGSVPFSFDSANPGTTSLSIADDFEIMDVYVHVNITHPPISWGGVRLELESPSGKVGMVFDRIMVADPTGLGWRTRINSTFGYDEAPSEVLWQFRGERTAGLWTLHASAVLDGGSPSTVHSWALYFFRYRHPDISRIVLTAAHYRNYVAGFDEGTGKPLYRARLQSERPEYPAAYPIAVAVTRDQRHACGGGYSDYNETRGGWTDSTVTCFETMTGKPVTAFSFSGNLAVDGIEVPRDADRLVGATNEYVYLIDTTTLQVLGSVPTGFSSGAPPPHLGLTPDGLRAYVGNEEGHTVLIVDLATMTFTGQIDLPGYAPVDVDVSADGTFGLISSEGSPSVLHTFDPVTNAITGTLPVAGSRAFQTVLSPDDSKAFYAVYQWYAGFGRTDLSSLATQTFKPDPESTTQALAMGRDGTLYVADWYIQQIWVYDATTEVLARGIVVPDRVYPAGIDVVEVVPKVALLASGGDGYVSLNWVPPPSYGSAVQGYTIYRGTQSGEAVRHATVGATNSYLDLDVLNGQTYYYQVSAVNGAGEGAPSNEARVTPGLASEPLNLQASAASRQVSLSWNAPTSNGGFAITSYRIYRGFVGGGEILFAIIGNATSFTDTGLTNGQTYYYMVTAVNEVGEGPPSNEASATPAAVPGPPIGLSAATGDRRVTLTWAAPGETGGFPIANYTIYRGTASGAGAPLEMIGTALSYADTRVTNGVTYYYRVSGRTAAGEGPPSTETSATPSAPPGNQPPTCIIASPAPGDTVSSTFSARGTASDADGGVERVEVRVDAGTWAVATGTESWSYPFDMRALNDGPHTIFARSFDGTNYSVEVGVTVTVRNADPPPSGGSIVQQVWFWGAVGTIVVGATLLAAYRLRRNSKERERNVPPPPPE